MSRRKASLHFADLVLDRLRIDLEETDVRRWPEFTWLSGGLCEGDHGLEVAKNGGKCLTTRLTPQMTKSTRHHTVNNSH